ncbi:hypothetical protein M501DRAFT_939295 [Patellaria atrata CBS 101060]|uniref:F-box domain-containing protein n=1 Tax=Patellaria atrata CBS 101060 TaxID=1346257 RepID=A0A9P4S6C3_9PEZI|nr:hypothetical protein M501DRAFT_939295 [Patellaria atrata CBS 101060]
MHINAFPYEILSVILEEAAKLNEQDGVTFTFGLSQAPLPLQKANLHRYIRGPVPPDMLKWDATAAIRQVCREWHEWAVEYALTDVYIRRWRGSERWAELSQKRENYDLYELIEKPSGTAVYRDPYRSLRSTSKLFQEYPHIASNVRRLWFNGFYTTETDHYIHDALKKCSNLTSVSVPWTVIRHLSAQDWAQLLGNGGGEGLQSLELLAVDLTESQAKDRKNLIDLQPLKSHLVDFSRLRRLKIFGNTTFKPIDDEDLRDIARTATKLEEFHLTNLSTITIEGVMAVVKASQNTLRVLEHSPRSDDGFDHPHPGSSIEGEHLCEVLANLPRLKTLSISIPTMCSAIFANENVQWEGDCQVRAAHICGHQNRKNGLTAELRDPLQALLQQARALITTRANSYIPKELTIELFCGDIIFDPHLHTVHGNFELGRLVSYDQWPASAEPSRKGPYGSTGLYGKDDEEVVFERVHEDEFLNGMRKNWVSIFS